jgi:hypothetical protein
MRYKHYSIDGHVRIFDKLAGIESVILSVSEESRKSPLIKEDLEGFEK